MKELDFDELDRAVNSLMPNVTNADTPVDDDVKTLTIPSSSPSTEQLSSPAPAQPAAPAISSHPAATSTPLAARRGGRFMDVVHPSSDMKKPESTRPAPVSRQGVTIAPSPSATMPETPASAPEVQPPKVEQTPPAHEPVHMENEWPDPLDMADFKHEPEPKPEAVSEQPKEEDDSKDEEAAPLTSPFLPDTKVEKRPLGGPAIVGDSIEPTPNTGLGKQDLTVDDPSDQLPAAPEEVAVQMPEELQGDLVAIESGAASKDLPTEVSPADTVPETPKEPAPVSETPRPKEEDSKPSGPVSIPQQYREEPSTGEAQNGSIYDTDTYHQPLVHPGKKKSGWLWVVWIVLILLVGAGAGAALYFLGVV